MEDLPGKGRWAPPKTPIAAKVFPSAIFILRLIASGVNEKSVSRREKIKFGTEPVSNSSWTEVPKTWTETTDKRRAVPLTPF